MVLGNCDTWNLLTTRVISSPKSPLIRNAHIDLYAIPTIAVARNRGITAGFYMAMGRRFFGLERRGGGAYELKTKLWVSAKAKGLRGENKHDRIEETQTRLSWSDELMALTTKTWVARIASLGT